MQLLYIREFGKIVRGEENEQKSVDEITLNRSAWDFLAKYAESDKEDDRFIRFVKSTTLKVKNFVGVITTPDGTQIEILPKIEEVANDKSVEQSRSILEKMLKVVNDLPFIQTTEADLKLKNRPLPEVLIGWFLKSVDKIIKQGIRRDYLRMRGHEKFLKGQLQTHKQLNEPPHKQHLFHIEYDILSPNRCENRLIHSALLQILKWSKDFDHQKTAKHFLMLFDEVPASENIKNDFNQWASGRDMNYYQSVLPWLKLILNQQSPFALKDKNAGISFLLPMEVLFERYVAKKLAERLPKGYKLTEQKPQKPLAYFENNGVFMMKPDIVISKISNKNPVCILDTKWKLIDENQTYKNGSVDNKRGISQSDMYQLFAYGKKYKVAKVVLIYPQWTQFENEFAFQIDENLDLCVKPFALDDDKMTAFGLSIAG
ncbi:McrC family protein [Bathymodiolus septemdierum thioautotrophic gill symbiont]|uniref:Restriction endonuclease n=1 Tax=endosymbiont of Bathymodiolus septemdierum str. Myojin knoll TaxID=1303921 RepID=A0A0P0UQ57_9GAMM|nr:McrC family protein [Bathymodiolus septemdierum thioautotrophic gill symbiont]BAS67138.1 conserved hypothetical protein [endosymbiont of Bathymodiolus septemdierum str. Myojin knoll]